jgi:hypothetical protein
VIVEPLVYGPRVLMALGWLAAAQLIPRHQEAARAMDVLRVFRRELPHQRFLGEADWPAVMSTAMFLARWESQGVAERLVGSWVDSITSACLAGERGSREGVPSPYWLPERVLALRGGHLPRDEEEVFGENSYTVLSATDMLVRRHCRQRVATIWPQLSRLTLCDFAPGESADWFLWRCSTGDVVFEHPSELRSWSAWRSEAAVWQRARVPSLLRANPGWVLPFALTFPHRANRTLCGMLDDVIGQVATGL